MGTNWGSRPHLSPRQLRWVTVLLVVVVIAGVWFTAPELLCGETREVCEASP